MESVKRVLMMVLAGSFILPLAACGKLDQMMGKKGEEVVQQDQKMKELEAKVQQMEAEAKARKEAEEKAKAEAEMRAKIEAELKAKAETLPAAPTAAATKAPVPTKVTEKVIIKEVPAKPTAEASAPAAAKATGYVKLYDDAGFTDRSLTIRFGRDIGNMHNISSDDGKAGFNDKASSVKYSVPAGWQAVLYENDNYSKRGYSLKGSGSIPDLSYFGDKCSSVRWEKTSE